MKTHIARLIAVAVLVTAWSACLQAQTKAYYVSYAYDADGNRVSRTVCRRLAILLSPDKRSAVWGCGVQPRWSEEVVSEG